MRFRNLANFPTAVQTEPFSEISNPSKGRLPVHCSVGTVDDSKQVGVSPTHQKFVARQNFSIICESPCHYRMFFRGYYCIEFVVNGESKIFIRDGAHSRFSNSKILEGLNPISGLIPFFCNGRPLPEDVIGRVPTRPSGST